MIAEPVILTDLKGRQIEATLDGLDGGEALITKGGKSYRIKLDSLNQVSQDLVRASFPSGIVVSSLIVKRLPSGKFRYFFDVRNFSKEPFEGQVEIILHNKIEGIKNGKALLETSQAIPVKLGLVTYIDAHTGPEEFHGDASVASYYWRASSGNFEVGKGRHPITSKFENLQDP
jgi:hypothetical protein